MSIAYVTHRNNVETAQNFTAFAAATPVTGNALILCVFSTLNGTAQITGVSSTGATWTKLYQGEAGGASYYIDVWITTNLSAAAASAAASTGISVTRSGTGVVGVWDVREYSGLADPAAVDGSVSVTTGSGTTIDPGSLTTSNADDLLLLVSGFDNNFGGAGNIFKSSGPTNSFTHAFERDLTSGGEISLLTADLIVSATGSYDTSYVVNHSTSWAAALIAIEGASSSFPGSKTQTAVARIQAVLTATQSAKARIQNVVTATQSALSRIQNTVTKTQTAVARIAIVGTKTQAALARIQIIGTKTQPAISRIQVVGLVKTQPATARVQNTISKTQTATARISTASTFTKTQTATARIQNAASATQPATARVQATETKTQPAKARISAALTALQTAVARISKSFTRTQTATARISTTSSKTQPATARISITATATQTAVARIVTNTNALTGDFTTAPTLADYDRNSEGEVETSPKAQGFDRGGASLG